MGLIPRLLAIHASYRTTWLVFFAYSVLAALAVQFVVLPYLLPSLHAGDGLFVRLDSTAFHEGAVAYAERLRLEGWDIWSIRVDGGWLVAIAGAVYAATTPQPWTLIPINAVLHASAAFLVFLIVGRVVGRRRVALAATVPFLVYPSALSWYSQWHGDGWFILGNILFLYGWIVLARPESWARSPLMPGCAVAAIAMGLVLVWQMRPYGLIVMQLLALLSALLLTVSFAAALRSSRLSRARAAVAAALCWVMVAVVMVVGSQRTATEWVSIAPPDSAPPVSAPPPDVVAPATKEPSADKPASAVASAAPGSPSSRPASPIAPSPPPAPRQPVLQPLLARAAALPSSIVSAVRPTPTGTQYWQNISWLPGPVNNALYSIANSRDKYRRNYTDDNETNIDMHVGFEDAIELAGYVPRAAMIGFLAPFPSTWIEAGTRRGGTLLRRVTAVEMLLVYGLLVFLPYSVWRWRWRMETYLILLHCVIPLIIFSAIISNVGALYRFRYGYLMTLAALGAAGFLVWLQRRSEPLIDEGRVEGGEQHQQRHQNC